MCGLDEFPTSLEKSRGVHGDYGCQALNGTKEHATTSDNAQRLWFAFVGYRFFHGRSKHKQFIRNVFQRACPFDNLGYRPLRVWPHVSRTRAYPKKKIHIRVRLTESP